MDRWSDFSSQIDNAFSGNAPMAGKPGMGAGNVPFAPGVVSGQYNGMSPEAGRLYNQMQNNQSGQQMGQQMAQQAGVAPAGPTPPPQMTPMMQAQILDYLMKMMMQRASTQQKTPISTTGTF